MHALHRRMRREGRKRVQFLIIWARHCTRRGRFSSLGLFSVGKIERQEVLFWAHSLCFCGLSLVVVVVVVFSALAAPAALTRADENRGSPGGRLDLMKQKPVRAVRLVDFGYTQRSLEGFRPRSKRVMLPSAAVTDNELQPLATNEDGSDPKQSNLWAPPIDTVKARFPYCVVWTPLPVVAWLAPFVGHVGICREDGVILDFAGPFFVNVDNFAFGSPARYLRLDTEKCCIPPRLSAHTCEDGVSHATLGTGISWDDALRMGTHNYQHKSYNLFTCNCHSFTASCMNRLAYNGSIRWNVVDIGVMIFLKGRWVSYGAVARAFGPFFVVMAIGLVIAGWPFLIGWAAFSTLLLAWFLIATYFMNDVIHC